MNLIQRATVLALLASMTLRSTSSSGHERIPVRVVVVAAFDAELQNWITNLP